MSRRVPFVVRRSQTLFFRFEIPAIYRPLLGCREIVRTLRTCDSDVAAPYALAMAATLKALFLDLGTYLAQMDEGKPILGSIVLVVAIVAVVALFIPRQGK